MIPRDVFDHYWQRRPTNEPRFADQKMNKEKRYQILTRLRDENPAPTTELVYQTPFELLVAVMLSAHATDVSVNKATSKLYPIANTPEAILALGEAKLKSYIKTIGLFNTKAANVLKTCRILLDEHDGEVPRTRAALEALPGVGRIIREKTRLYFDNGTFNLLDRVCQVDAGIRVGSNFHTGRAGGHRRVTRIPS